MTKTKIDVQGLYAALDAERTARGLSWRQLAKEIDVSPSLLSRLGNELRPDADRFATLVRWLNMPAEQFMIDAEESSVERTQPELLTQLAPLLRARHDLEARDVAYLEDVIRATVRHARATREESE
jgi:transcriptional regulator with XRE-family HTH domain